MPTATEISHMMVQKISPETAGDLDATIQFDLSGDDGGQFYLVINNGQGAAYEGVADDARMTLQSTTEDWYKVMTGETKAMTAFMSGKIKIKGDMGLAMKMQPILG